MSAPDYSGTAVVTFLDKGYGDGMWCPACPVDCGWHGNEYAKRLDAELHLIEEKAGHKCLLATAAEAVADLDEIADLVRMTRDANEARAAEIEQLRGVGADVGDALREVNDRRMEVANWFLRRAEIGAGLISSPGPVS